MQVCTSSPTTTPTSHHHSFLQAGCPPATQPTASKHWRQTWTADNNQNIEMHSFLSISVLSTVFQPQLRLFNQECCFSRWECDIVRTDLGTDSGLHLFHYRLTQCQSFLVDQHKHHQSVTFVSSFEWRCEHTCSVSMSIHCNPGHSCQSSQNDRPVEANTGNAEYQQHAAGSRPH